MKIDLTPDAEEWVESEIARGRFASAQAAIQHAVSVAKLDLLRRELSEAEAEGGAFSADEVRQFAVAGLDRTTGSADQER